MKDIVKLDLPATIVIAGHSTLSGVSMGTLTVRVTDGQTFFLDMVLPAIIVLRLGRHLFSVGTVALKGVNTIIANELVLDVGEFKISLRIDIDCPTPDYVDLELASRNNYPVEAAIPTRIISGHTISMGSALVYRLLRSGAMGMVAPLAIVTRPFIVTTTVAQGLPALRAIASAHGVSLVRGGAMGAASAFIATTYFVAPTTMVGLPTAIATAAQVMPETAMMAAGGDYSAPAPETSERVHHAGRAEHRRDWSRFHRLADHLQHLQDQQGYRIANFQRAGQNRDHGPASAYQYRPLGPRDTHGTWELPFHGQVLRPLH